MKKYIYLALILSFIFTSCSTEKEEPNLESRYPVGSVFGPSGPTKIVDVTNPKTGRTWMDRNLGATRAANSSADVESYGDLYQWGRGADGHQIRTSGTTSTLSTTDQPENVGFILTFPSPNDWRSPQNTNLWQGVNGVNNPCPSGYRIPTEVEWEAERLSWNNDNASDAFASALKLLVGGFRRNDNGSLDIDDVGFIGRYSSSTVSGIGTRVRTIANIGASMNTFARGTGISVRCIKN